MTASHNPMVSKLVLQVPANSLVSSLWDGIRSRNFKKKFLEMGITKKKLRKFWKTLEPENNVDGLLGKEVHVVLSKQDRVVPYKYGRKLVSILRKMPVKLSVKTHKKSGHYITVLEELLFSNDF
jgi:hypothetical protein